MATVFNHMAGGRWWGSLFFLFMVFAAMSTVLAVCENILAMVREMTGWKRPLGCLVCGAACSCLPDHGRWATACSSSSRCGRSACSFWDFCLQQHHAAGSLVFAPHCCNKFGWGWDRFLAEANAGKG